MFYPCSIHLSYILRRFGEASVEVALRLQREFPDGTAPLYRPGARWADALGVPGKMWKMGFPSKICKDISAKENLTHKNDQDVYDIQKSRYTVLDVWSLFFPRRTMFLGELIPSSWRIWSLRWSIALSIACFIAEQHHRNSEVHRIGRYFFAAEM